MKAMKDGKIIDVTEPAARSDKPNHRRAWAVAKSEAQSALAATDYLALADRRPMSKAERAYREALRQIAKADPVGEPPALPMFPVSD